MATRKPQADQIRIRGAREHNLRDVSLAIPRRQITAFTGVSGSGKTSLVFDTIAAEAQRELNETFAAFVRNRLPDYGRPDVDGIDGLSPVVVINQKRLGGGARSTVGTITDIYALLRLLFSRASEPYVGESSAFSFNDPSGMCMKCSGLGLGVVVTADAHPSSTRASRCARARSCCRDSGTSRGTSSTGSGSGRSPDCSTRTSR